MSFFDEVETTVANTRFLQAVQDNNEPIRLQLKTIEQLQELNQKLTTSLTLSVLLKHNTIGYYLWKQLASKEGKDDLVDFMLVIDMYRAIHRGGRLGVMKRLLSDNLFEGKGEDYEPADLSRVPVEVESVHEENKSKEHGGKKRKKNSGFRARLFKAAQPALQYIQAQVDAAEKKRAAAEAANDPSDDNGGLGWGYLPSVIIDPIMSLVEEALKEDGMLKRWLESDFHPKWVQLSDYCARPVTYEDFRVFRVLGRGAFGAVSAVQKIDTHSIFAMKEMGKRQVKGNHSEWMCINEMKVLSKMCSPFVLNLKYSFHSQETLYLVFDMCSGGDLKFHLRALKDRCFPIGRAKLYAAEILLGLAHIHSFSIVYRDLKPDNILLASNGHIKISDLGLTIKLRKNKVLKHLAGTAGYWAPEIVQKSGTYLASDWWSFGVLLFEMLSGKRPKCVCDEKSGQWCPFGQSQKQEDSALSEDGKLTMSIQYPAEKFNPQAKALLERLFEVNPDTRMGAKGVVELQRHPFFSEINWDKLEALEITPEFLPEPNSVHANSIGEVGEFNQGKFKKIRLQEEDEKHYEDFTFTSEEGIQLEIIEALEKQALHPPTDDNHGKVASSSGGCCQLM